MNSDRGDGIYSLMEELKFEIRRTDHLCYPSYISRFYDELALLKFITKKKKNYKNYKNKNKNHCQKSLSSSNYLSKGHYEGTASLLYV